MARKIYLASSWRNKQQPEVLAMLRELGHEVYDFHNPTPEIQGFSWKQCKMEWGEPIDMHDLALYVRHIARDPVAQRGFKLDRDALHWCDTCVLLLPCGKSAHLEAGYAMGQGKETLVVLNEDGFEPELMYLLGDHICENVSALKATLLHTREARCVTAYGWGTKDA